ncbi:NEW3 domain-containing protein [Halopelagius fulvigenes]|uniref:NEW3 domain-containing protein n=1 Tax=Halopelagius fulvigenes TaxID=1198324 RepID=A0ABD5U3C0_9EURY
MKRALLLTAVVVASALAGVGAVDGAPATAFVSNVTVSPDQPAPGERFTISTTVRNADQSGSSFEITDVYVRTRGGTRDVTRVENLGTIPPGAEMKVPLTASFDDPGTRELRVFVVGRSDGEFVRLQYPVVVTVRQGGPQVSIDADDGVVGAENRIEVTAANGEDAPVRNLRLSVSGTDADVKSSTRVLPTLAAGESRTFNVSVTPSARRSQLEARLQYTTRGGNTRVVADTTTLRSDPLREDVRVDASVAASGASPPIVADVSNLGNAPLEDAVVEGVRNGTVVFRRPVGAIGSDASATTQVNVSGVSGGPLDVRLRYETGGREGEATTTLDYTANPGAVELTGVDYEMEGGRLHISGSTSNVGLSQVDSVVVRVLPTENVTPARPREYFVGSIPSSDFVSFDVYAEVDENASSVPLEVSYLSNGERKTRRTEVDVRDLQPAEPAQSGGGGSLPGTALLVGGVVALLLVVGVGAYAYRRR